MSIAVCAMSIIFCRACPVNRPSPIITIPRDVLLHRKINSERTAARPCKAYAQICLLHCNTAEPPLPIQYRRFNHMKRTAMRNNFTRLKAKLKKAPADASAFCGAGSGIRTHAPLRANGFQDRLVMTASISLHIRFDGRSAAPTVL